MLDLALIHAPSVYDFRNRDDILFAYLGNSDSVHVSPVFEMPPVGMLAIEQYMNRRGAKTVFYNVASHMLRNSGFDAEDFLARLETKYLGLDLHWLAHAHGALELAGLYKKLHPEGKVILGGMSASYFHSEAVEYPQVDYVLRGADTLEAVYELVRLENMPCRLEKISGLTWKRDGVIVENELRQDTRSYMVSVDWEKVLKSKSGTVTPYNLVIPQYGCEYNCFWCEGSKYSARKELGLDKVVHKSPETLKRELQSILDSGSRKHTVTMINYWHEYDELLGAASDVFENDAIDKVHISVRRLPDPERISSLGWKRKLIIELSPDSHNMRICKACGHGHYTMDEMERFIDSLLNDVCIFEVYFMIGAPQQTVDDVWDTLRYCEHLLKKYEKYEKKRVIPYICPMLPFLDPGSVLYDHAEKHGYRIFFRRLEDYRKALLSMNWKDRLNYETKWMSKDELVDITYKAVKELTRLKVRYGVLPKGVGDGIVELIDRTQDLLAQIDEFQSMEESAEKAGIGAKLKKKILEYNREQLSRVRSQQRPLDLGFARQQWFDTEEAFRDFYKGGTIG